MASQPRLPAAAHARELDTQLRRFPRGYRRRLRKLVRGSARLGELLHTFPVLACVLAAGRRPLACGDAIDLVKNGRPLAEAAAAAGVAMWMRRLPPEAFDGELPAIAASEEFGRRIVNHIPVKAELTSMWLRWVLFGAVSCGESFALWLAKQAVYQGDDRGKTPLLPLAAFAWFSQAEAGAGRGLIGKPWHGNMRFGAAVEESREWFERVILDYCHDGELRNGGWFRTMKVCGYRFWPLLTPDDLREEGGKMRNCVATYIPKVASGACLVYSIRRGGQRVATLEIGRRGKAPAIVQLEAPGNAKAGEDVWRAADRWLSKLGDYPLVTRDAIAQVPIRAGRWQAVWMPYIRARPAFKARVAEPSMQTLASLRQDTHVLARLEKG